MEFTTLGRTGIEVSRMGLGCGGHSRLGTASGGSEEDAIRVVREAISLGANFVDTAEAYGTEEIVGKAIKEFSREAVVISTKVGVERDGRRSTPEEYRERVLGCLKRLEVDYVDIIHIHGLSADHYAYAKDWLVPVLLDLQSEGRVRFLGVTEAFAPDPSHRMLALASEDDLWDVIMVGFNLLNQSARQSVLPWTQAKKVGTLGMFAVRTALSKPSRLSQLIREMATEGVVDESEFNLEDPLGFLVADGVASSVTEAAYRFCLHEPGLDVILSGTGSVEHLRENARSLSMGPLPAEIVERLRRLFARVDNVSGN